MTLVIAAPAANTTVTADIEEVSFEEFIEKDQTDPYAKCFLSHRELDCTRLMKALLVAHPEAKTAPIISDKDICGHDETFGHNLIAEMKSRYPDVAVTGFFILCTGYGLKHHSLDPVRERFLVKRCMHACSR